MKNLLLSLLLLFALSSYLFSQEARLLRFPATNGNQIAFTYAGDLYLVGVNGGIARKITSNIGFEMFPRFSPDGKNIAFTAQYDGNTEVYLIPSEGGSPKRLTVTATLDRDDVSDRMGPNNIVMGWKNNETIVYRSRWREFNDFKGHLYSVNVQGGPSIQLPLPRGGFCSYSPDGSKLAYNRVFREFRTWKRYRGGQADDIWIYDFKDKSTTNITNNPAQDIIPMWYGDRIFFVSDRNNKMNIYSYDLISKETKQLTDFKDYDVKFPSLGSNLIVFENGGYIYKYDVVANQLNKITVEINEDFNTGRGGLLDVSGSVMNYEISPDGKRALFGARGEIFTVPSKDGATRNLTNTPGVHERNSLWSPDGKWIAYISDESGEDEIYIRTQEGLSKPVRLTSNGNNYKYSIRWSPDSKKILWNDRAQNLQFVDVESKKVTLVAKSDIWEYSVFSWSPDNKFIAYVNPETDANSVIYIYSLDQDKSYPVTDSWYDVGSVAFSSDCKYLFFTSARTFTPQLGQTEFNHIYTDMEKIYLLTLSKETKSPFEPKSDEVEITSGAIEEKKDEKKDIKSNPTVKLDIDGIISRVAEVTPVNGMYRSLTSVGNKLYYMKRVRSPHGSSFAMFDFDKLKETDLGDVSGYEISADGKKILVGQGGSYAILDLPSSKIEIKDRLNLSDLKINLDRKQEWKQIFNESWRQMRDFFYAPNLHNVNWEKMKERYSELLPYVNHRADLTYIIGEMIGELNAGHAYVGGGDYLKAPRIKLGLLGAELSRDSKSGFYRIDRILKGQNWDKSLRSPLTDIGVDVKEGDYILEVNGKSTSDMLDIYESLINQQRKQVTLTVNSKPELNNSRKTVVIPIENEHSLYYLNWVEGNIEKVDKATDGKVGYIHVPDMSLEGLNQFVKYYYPQLKKQALIIDVRGNGGGFVSPMIAERLNRELSMITIARNSSPNTDPSGLHLGPKVALLDEFSASDGDIFPYRFKHHKMGKLVGKRSWGGVVGIRGTLPFVDGGYLNKPEFSRYDIEGKEWIMEGYGVDPDIEVDNDPALEYEGTDQQLNKAIEVILNELKQKPHKIAPPPPYPDKK
ncbi:MAG TPA: PDZ domain-containing protein [Ignavibacteriaceae bacterium]|nr:PDZ domain-containing protein [Ignavibacteriaceae bacterium]